MAKILLEEAKANVLVKKELLKHGFRDNLTIQHYIADNSVIYYCVREKITYDDQPAIRMTNISCPEYMGLLRDSLNEDGDFENSKIFPQIRENQIRYQIFHTTAVVKTIHKRR